MNICVYGAASNSIDRIHIEKAEELGKFLAKRGHSLVFGGGCGGVMGATSRGAEEAGAEKIIGVIPKFFNIDGVLSKNCTEIIYTDTMRERKRLLEELSDAVIVAPGGVGTFDEFFEILSLKQLGRTNKPIVVYNALNYYAPIMEMLSKAIEGNFMSERNKELIYVSDSFEEIFNYIENYDYNKTIKLSELKDIKSENI